jgi:hypothetical protein
MPTNPAPGLKYEMPTNHNTGVKSPMPHEHKPGRPPAISDETVRLIKRFAETMPYATVAKHFGISDVHVGRICRGKARVGGKS